ncbi:MAG: hypothetical protein SFV54_25030 [Bryobacteraceae bacterium]|nr:hypothetical protein [Bryobacteraceae bacterium]
MPNVSVEPLGLRHAHVFVTDPVDRVLAMPYAVEAAWVTPDFCQEVLYLHCLVPARIAKEFVALAEAFGASTRVVWSSSGWQQFLLEEEPMQLPLPVGDLEESEILRRLPFVVPAMMELWTYPNSLPVIWQRIRARLGKNVKAYLPRTKVRYVNGKTHVTQAFGLLQNEGLVRQQLIRYHPLLAVSVEVFLLIRQDREETMRILDVLRWCLHAVESYPTTDGYWCRLLGPHRLLDAIMNLPSQVRSQCGLVYFHTKRHPTPIVRFGYEAVFDVASRTWRTA